ncbi:tetratricopeptide repeat protein [Polaribacter sp.]|jgi:tetratricopeptide (TPR) repeat protein|uniref:tetratricopeptide repeat protein n=1 Tax=Polaribacter sp. TaxID=1920175 RepID=UPI004047495B
MKQFLAIIFFLFSSSIFSQDDPQSEFFLAENYFREGDYEKATQIYKKLYDVSPFNTTYLYKLISCYQQTESFETAENLLLNRLKKDPSQTYLHVLIGNNYSKLQKENLAEIEFQKALKSIENNSPYATTIAQIFNDYNLLKYAILAYKKAMEKNPSSNFNFQIAQIYGEQGDYKKMFESYIDLLDKNERYLSLIQRYASKYITDDAENEANILFRKTLLQKSVKNPKNEWNILLSWLFIQQKEYEKALVQEKALFNRNPTDVSMIFELGQIAFEDKNYETAQNCFDFIIEKSSQTEEKIEANLYLIKIAIATKNPETFTIFEKLFTEFGINAATINLQVAYADFLTFQKNEPENAIAILEKAMTFSNSKFEEARIKLKLADVFVFTGNFNKALIYFSQIQTQLKNHELGQEAQFKVAQTSYFKGDFDWAKAQLKVLKSATTQLIANDAVELYLKIIDNEPVDSIPSGLKEFANAELLFYQNKYEEALKEINRLFYDKTILANGLIPGEIIYDDVLFLEAKIYIKQEKFIEAIEQLEKIIAADNQGYLTDDVYYRIAEIYNFNLNNPEKAKEYYQKIVFEQHSSIYLVDARNKFRKLRGEILN